MMMTMMMMMMMMIIIIIIIIIITFLQDTAITYLKQTMFLGYLTL